MNIKKDDAGESIESILGAFSVADYLEALREERGISTKKEWANLLGLVTKQQYTNILNGSHKLSLDRALAINHAIEGDENVMVKVWMDEQLHNAKMDGSVIYVPSKRVASNI